MSHALSVKLFLSFCQAPRTSLLQSEPRWAPKMWFSRRFARTSRWAGWVFSVKLEPWVFSWKVFPDWKELTVMFIHDCQLKCCHTTKLHSLIFINEKLHFQDFFFFFCFFLVLFFSTLYIYTFVFVLATWQRDTFTEARIVSYACFCHYRISVKRFLIWETGGGEPESFKGCLVASLWDLSSKELWALNLSECVVLSVLGSSPVTTSGH